MHPVNHHKIQRGFTLIELIVSLTIMATLATVLIRSSVGLQDQSRYEQTVGQFNKIKSAIVNVQTVNGVPLVNGFLADMGRLPISLSELLSMPLCSDGISTSQAICTGNSGYWYGWQQDLASGLWYGWHGPYLQSNYAVSATYALSDGWGNQSSDCLSGCNYGWNYSADNTFVTGVTLQSYGSSGASGQHSPADYTALYPDTSSLPALAAQDLSIDLGSTAVMVNLMQTDACSGASCPTVCLNIYYRYYDTGVSTTQIGVATAASINKVAPSSGGVSQQLYFMGGFHFYSTSTSSTPPSLLPVGQNAISITNANSIGHCDNSTYSSGYYPISRFPSGSGTPLPQTFMPRLSTLIFNW